MSRGRCRGGFVRGRGEAITKVEAEANLLVEVISKTFKVFNLLIKVVKVLIIDQQVVI